jgi:nucleoside-diphosphate-sugar epimerase
VKVVVTGAAGFIGSQLVEKLLAEGHDPRLVVEF